MKNYKVSKFLFYFYILISIQLVYWPVLDAYIPKYLFLIVWFNMSKVKKNKTTSETESNEIFSFREVQSLPESTIRQLSGKYVKTVMEIAKIPRKTIVEIELGNQKLKSAYPSFDRAIGLIAKRKGIRWSDDNERRQFRSQYLRLRVVNNKLYIEKLCEEPIV